MNIQNKIVVIDEALSVIKELKLIIEEFDPLIEVMGLKKDKVSLKTIESFNPDIVFVSGTIVEESIMEMITKIARKKKYVILTSSDSNDVLKAFEYEASNFVLKPFDTHKILKILDNFYSSNADKTIASNLSKPITTKNFIPVHHHKGVDILPKKDILYCVSAGKYTTFYMSDGNSSVSSTNLGVYESSLIAFDFFRIHHSYIINLNQVTKIIKQDGMYCELSNGIKIPVSKRKEKELLRFLRL